MSTNEALIAARDALEQIALAGMSGTGQESEEGMHAWHARRAWEFIGIAARALEPLKVALANPAPAPEGHGEPNPWRDLFWSVARALGCLPSTFVNGNEHVYRQAEKLAAAAAAPAPAQAAEVATEASELLGKYRKLCALSGRGDGAHLDRIDKAITALTSTAAAAAPVAYLDIGFGGFLDLGTELDHAALMALPKGRHLLGIMGSAALASKAAASEPAAWQKRFALGHSGLEGWSDWCICSEQDGREMARLQHWQVRALYAHAPAAVAAEPVAWIRVHPDGSYAGDLLLDGSIEPVRRDSGAWVPLGPIRALANAPSAAPASGDAADEPVAWFAFGDSNGPVPLELYGWDKKACLHAVLENARATGWKGTVNGYLLEQGWTVRPVWLHPYASERAAPDASPSTGEPDQDGERYRHLRACNSGSLVIVKITGTGDDDQVVLTEADADAELDAEMARFAAHKESRAAARKPSEGGAS